jgi:hypothetical protein
MGKMGCLYVFIKRHKEKVRLLAIKEMNEKYPYCDDCEKRDKDAMCYKHRT